MTHLRTTAHLEAPIDRIFELVTDFKRYPEWNVNYLEVPEVIGPTNRVGTRIHAVMRLLDRKLTGWAEVVEIEQPNHVKISGRGDEGGTTVLEYRLQPRGLATEIEALIDYELPAGPFGKVLDRLFIERAVERDLRHSIENFKALVEAPEPVLV